MFFIARTVAPMLTGSCGSYSTTTTDERIESVIGAFEWNEAVLVLTIAAQVDELAAAAAQHQLAPAAAASARHLVDDDVECRRQLARHVDAEAVAAVDAVP